MAEPPVLKVYEQPMRTIFSRTRTSGGIVWAELECGHVETATGKDLFNAIRCQQCDPVRRPGWT